MSTWADVGKGDIVELSGRPYTVVKIKKRDDGTAKVTVVRGGGQDYSSVVELDAAVTISGSGAAKPLRRSTPVDPRGDSGARPPASATLPVGDSTMTGPPEPATGRKWSKQADDVERRLGDLLQARLVGESKDEAAGYYVPPVDVATVAAHLALFHGGIPDSCADEGSMVAAHEDQHTEALHGTPLPVNHWHTERRPAS